MRLHILFLFLANLFINGTVSAQNKIDLKELLNTIDWNNDTETELVYSFRDYIEKVTHDEWEEEGSSSDYQFKNVTLENLNFSSAIIRVNAKSKKIYRVNFLLKGIEEHTKAQVESYLKKHWEDYGLYSENKVGDKILMQTKTWITKDYKLNAIFTPTSNDYFISIEPIHYYPVSYTKVAVQLNTYNIQIPKIEYVAIDNQSDVYIKEYAKEVVVHPLKKMSSTPKGKIIFFEGGSDCHREDEADIVYIQQGFAATYPIRGSEK